MVPMSTATATKTNAADLAIAWTAAEVSHATDTCPAALPGGEWEAAPTGWLCTECITVDRPLRMGALQGVNIDAPENTGGAAGSRIPVAEPVTWVKHDTHGWVLRVPAGAGAEGDTVTVYKANGDTAEVTLGGKVGTRRGAALHTPARDAAENTTYRWAKLGTDWVVTGPEAAEGSTVTVTKKDGSTAEAVLISKVGTVRGAPAYTVRRADDTAEGGKAAAPLADVPEGYFAITSGGSNDLMFVRVDRPTEGRWAGRTFAKMIVGGRPDERIAPARVPGILARIAEAGVEEAARLYGQEIGRCCRCNRHLTDEVSRREGIGPECKSKAGF